MLAAGDRLVRIYNPSYLGPIAFNYNGPRSRFDHHCSDDGSPREHLERGIYYASSSLAGCVIEVFGDAGVIELQRHRVALVQLDREVRLLDLTGDGAWKAGSVAALTKHSDREFSQTWSRYFYENPASYERIDGVRYENAHNAAEAFAFYERASALRHLGDYPLAAPELRAELAAIALELHLDADW